MCLLITSVCGTLYGNSGEKLKLALQGDALQGGRGIIMYAIVVLLFWALSVQELLLLVLRRESRVYVFIPCSIKCPAY